MITLSAKSNTSMESTSLLSNPNNNYDTVGSLGLIMSNDFFGMDAFGGKDLFGSPDFSSMNESFFANGAQAETAGSIAFGGVETAGSVAFSGAETAGSVACGDSGASCGGGSFASVC